MADAYESKALQDRIDALGLNDRAADIWKPLFAVVSVAAEKATAELETLCVEMSPDPDRQEELRQLRIFSALRTLAGPDGVLAATTQHIVERLKTVTALDVPDLHSVLAQWRFPEKNMRLPEFDTPRKGADGSGRTSPRIGRHTVWSAYGCSSGPSRWRTIDLPPYPLASPS
jgi:Protein of unknown function (DUF3631)